MTSRAASPPLKRVPPCCVPFCDAVDCVAAPPVMINPLSQCCPQRFLELPTAKWPHRVRDWPGLLTLSILGSPQRPAYRLIGLDRIGFLLRPFKAALEVHVAPARYTWLRTRGSGLPGVHSILGQATN